MLEASSPFSQAEPFVGPTWIDRPARWVRAHAGTLLVLAVALQLAVLLAMIAIHVTPLLVGERVLLHVRPVDPRDYFRGDYVVLAYDFSQVPPEGVDGLHIGPRWRSNSYYGESSLADRTVYVPLEKEEDGKHYRAGKPTTVRPASGLFLKGRFARDHWGNNLQFGIEAFYVQEGEGKVLEKVRNSGNLSAEVAIAPWGQATLVSLQ